MSKIPFHSRLLRVADNWRAGAVEMRDQFRDHHGKVPFSVEVGANGLEVCAERLEAEVREHLESQRPPAAPEPAIPHPSPLSLPTSPNPS